MGPPKRMAAKALVLLTAANVALFGRFSKPSPHTRQPQPTTLVSPSLHVPDPDTTVIITSSLIPSHPSLELINQTISSIKFIDGISDDTPMIITVDGAYKTDRGSTSKRQIVLDQYIQALRMAYKKAKILTQPRQIFLVGNVMQAMSSVNTEFVYVIQHDMPFVSSINHRALVKTFQDFPDELRLVRFSPRKTLVRQRDKLGLCGDNVDLEANGISFAKTHTWSDNNHFTRKSYYEEMFSAMNWENVRFMETKMNPLGAENCSYWGTYLYGKQGVGPPMIRHMDGRNHLAVDYR